MPHRSCSHEFDGPVDRSVERRSQVSLGLIESMQAIDQLPRQLAFIGFTQLAYLIIERSP